MGGLRQAPFGGPAHVIDYLGRYTHRVALSNQRLLACDDQQVTFQYKDYRSAQPLRSRQMTLPVDEFLRRFLLHVLPSGFPRIRHYGLLTNRFRSENLALCRKLLVGSRSELLPSPVQLQETLKTIVECVARCPQCQVGSMVRTTLRFAPVRWSPTAPPAIADTS
jgi:hypothetical protein